MSTSVYVDHYAILSVKYYASNKEVNDAWKRFALKYHPDKCNDKRAHQEFLKGLEAIQTLRDPRRREDHDKELRAHETPPGTNRPEHSDQRSRNNTYYRNGHHRSPPKYSTAQMDMIFETVKRREKERIAAEREKALQAEAELKERQLETERKMHAWETNYRPSGDIAPQKAPTEIYAKKKIATTLPDEKEPVAETFETLSNRNRLSGPDTTVSHRSTVFASASTSFCDNSDFTWLHSAPDSSADWDDSSTDSDGGISLANLETQKMGKETVHLDRDDLDLTRSRSSPVLASTGQFTEGTMHPPKIPSGHYAHSSHTSRPSWTTPIRIIHMKTCIKSYMASS